MNLSNTVEGESSHSSNSSSTQHTSNPHQPCSQLKLFYFNARSIVLKLDELLTLVQCEHPDVICIVESWLKSDILDSEISIPGYQVFRKDRNRHGGLSPVRSSQGSILGQLLFIIYVNGIFELTLNSKLMLYAVTCCSIVLLTILRTWVLCNKILTPSQIGSQLTI